MVTKSPKTRILSKRRFKNVNPRVRVEKLDENVFKAYRDRLAGISCNSSFLKKERACIFTSEVDLNENEHVSSISELGCGCQCGYCSPYYEIKLQTYEKYLNAVENQENFTNPQYPYLCDVVQDSAQQLSHLRNVVQENTHMSPVVEKVDASTQTSPRQYRFTCKDCYSQFNNEYYYEQHIMVHRKLFECPFCNASFINEKQLQPHVLQHMSKNFFECIYCNCVFSNKKLLLKHISCHDKSFFECGECKAKFTTDKGLQNHKKSHVSSGKMIHVFRLAKAGSLSPSLCQSQQPEVSGRLPPMEVIVVETESAGMDSLEVLQKNGKNFFECDACHLRFSNERNLNKHSIIHRRNATNFLHFCGICGARFRANNHLVCHRRHAHMM